ncbi:MAG: hypothetical protein MUE31_07790 [Candidatus Nanopelagicales bacterium]|jgi:hypothetical protein|nr:hypothetical protein [Candidatus Nanopelagicales bacterium]
MSRARPLDPDAPITFQAALPDAGDWIKSNKDQSRVLLIVPLEVGAVLTAATPRLAEKVLRVTVQTDGDQ